MDTSLGFSCSISIMLQYLETLWLWHGAVGQQIIRFFTHMLEEPAAGNTIKDLNATRISKSLHSCTYMSAEDLGAVTMPTLIQLC